MRKVNRLHNCKPIKMVNQLSDILQLIKNSFVWVLHNISSLCMSTKVLFIVNVKKWEILSILDMVIEWTILFVTLKAWHQNEWNGFCVFSCPMSTGHILNDCYSRGVVWLTIHWMDPRTTRLCILTTVAMVLFSLQMLTGSQSR